MKWSTILSCLVLLVQLAGEPAAAVASAATDPASPAAVPAAPVQDAAAPGETAEPPSTPRPATTAEVRDYEQRQAESPEVQDFTGGVLGVIAVILLVILIVLIVD